MHFSNPEHFDFHLLWPTVKWDMTSEAEYTLKMFRLKSKKGKNILEIGITGKLQIYLLKISFIYRVVIVMCIKICILLQIFGYV